VQGLLARSNLGRVGLATPSLPVLLFVVATGLRLLSFLIFYLASLATGHGGLINPYDSVGIDRWAWYTAEHWWRGEPVNLTLARLGGSWDVGFTYFVAAQYFVVGHHSEVPRLVNLLLAGFCAPAVYWAARATPLGEQVARRAGWLTALWPLSIYWAGYDLLKDPAVWFLLALAMLAITTTSRARFVALGVAAAVPMVFVRLYMGTALYLLLPLAALLRRDWKAALAIAAVLLVADLARVGAGFPPALSVTAYRGNGVALTGSASQPEKGSLRDIAGAVTAQAPSATAAVEGQGTDTVSSLDPKQHPAAIPIRGAVGLPILVLGPRPAIKDIVQPTIDSGMYPGLIVWYLLIPFTLLGLWRGIRTREPSILNLVILSVGIWVGLSVLFAGAAFRQREMAFPSTLIFTALGLSRPWPRRWVWVYVALLVAGVALLAVREFRLL
jgi:hypothetical protein